MVKKIKKKISFAEIIREKTEQERYEEERIEREKIAKEERFTYLRIEEEMKRNLELQYLNCEYTFREELTQALEFLYKERFRINNHFTDVIIRCRNEKIELKAANILKNPFSIFNNVMDEIKFNRLREYIRFILCSDIYDTSNISGKTKIINYLSARPYYKDSEALDIFDRSNDDEKENTIILLNRYKDGENVYNFYRINLFTMKIMSKTCICPE